MRLEVLSYKYPKLNTIEFNQFNFLSLSLLSDQIKYPLIIFPLNFYRKAKIRKLGLVVFLCFLLDLRNIYFLLLSANI